MIFLYILSMIGIAAIVFVVRRIIVNNPMSILYRKAKFKESTEFKPTRGWMLIYSEQEDIHFHHNKELIIYKNKQDADFSKRTHGMLAGFVKVVPCEVKILEEVT